MSSQPTDETEAPLDPAVERVQRRLRRLILIAGLTLGLGMLAVFGAIVYRLSFSNKAPLPGQAVLTATAAAPAGAHLLSTVADGNRLILSFEYAGGTTIILVDSRSLAVTGRLDLKPEQITPAVVP